MYAQSCPTLCGPMDCSLSGSPVHGILQARILEWVAIPYSRGSAWPRDQTLLSYVSCISKKNFFFLFFIFLKFYFKTLHNCISFAKYQNESATGIHLGSPETPLRSLVYCQYQQTLLLSLKKDPLSAPREKYH